jgi:hypothetical protein
MSKSAFLAIILLVGVLSTAAQMKDVYRPGGPPPPTSMDPDYGKTAPGEPKPQRRIDPMKLQQDADDLARTAQTIPSDVANMHRNTLPKYTIQKLEGDREAFETVAQRVNP